jgi:hypothetical protein
MPKLLTATHVIAAILFAAFVTHAVPAAAQETNPFVGTWGTSQMLQNGGSGTAFMDVYANGTFHLAALAAGPPGSNVSSGQVWHFCGTYQFNQTTLQTMYTGYSPHLCSMGVCQQPPVPINQPQTLQYQFPNPNELILSDGTHYVRQPSNPYPLPPNGCT